MCGIAGFIDKTKSLELLKAMTDTLSHRGPDDSGYFLEEGVGLGHRRLSILDLSPRGHQPMSFEHLIVVFNGEIYNFKEIRSELQAKGYTFTSDSDTEVLLKAFHLWGPASVEKFIGMFAFALYDKKKRELFLFRDRIGVKPLYYFWDGRSFAFASELRALKKGLPALHIDKDALFEYLQFGYISAPRSIFQNVQKLEPAHYLVFAQGRIEKKRYWGLEGALNAPSPAVPDEAKLADELEALLISAFSYRMVADVPVGVFLSGGIDSSLVSAILQKHYGQIRTFTVGFNEAKYNEAPFAKAVAQHIGTEHTEKILDISLAQRLLPKFVDIYDEPFGDSSGIPTFLVSQVAKEHGMKVVLSADAGDELFCGYDRYWNVRGVGDVLFKVPAPLKRTLGALMGRIKPETLAKFIPARNFAHRYNKLQELLTLDSWQELYEKMIAYFKAGELQELGGRLIATDEKSFVTGEKKDPMQGMMLWDLHRYLPDAILVKVDRATMYNSIEGREPLLDHRLIEFAAKLPFDLKYRQGNSKYILKKVLERYVPRRLFERPKQGFGIPLFEWFSGELGGLFRRYLSRERIEAEGFFNYSYIEKALKSLGTGSPLETNKLWLILVFEMWYEKWMR